MEGFNTPKTKERPTDEPERFFDHGERVGQAERVVRKIFDANMEAPGIITDRIKENPSFSSPSDRNF